MEVCPWDCQPPTTPMHGLNPRSGDLKLVSTITQTYVRENKLNKAAEPYILIKCRRCGNQRVSTHRVVPTKLPPTPILLSHQRQPSIIQWAYTSVRRCTDAVYADHRRGKENRDSMLQTRPVASLTFSAKFLLFSGKLDI